MGEDEFSLLDHLNFLPLDRLKLSECQKKRLDIGTQGFDSVNNSFLYD